MELRNVPQNWMEFSNCLPLPIDTADDMQTEAIRDSIDVEMNIENQFTTVNDSNFNVDDGLWSTFSTKTARFKIGQEHKGKIHLDHFRL
jgi:hypothetical protein